MGKNNDRYVVKHEDGWAVKSQVPIAPAAFTIHSAQPNGLRKRSFQTWEEERFAFKAVTDSGVTQTPCRPETILCHPATVSTK